MRHSVEVKCGFIYANRRLVTRMRPSFVNGEFFVGVTHNNLFVDPASAIGLCGLTYHQHRYVSSFDELSPRMSDVFYESGWKLGLWDLNEPSNANKTFGYYQYAAVKDIHQNNLDSAKINIDCARRSCVTSMAGVCFESTKNICNILAKLQCLQVC